MAHLFDKVLNKTRSKSPNELVAKTYAALEKLTDSASEKQQEDLAKYLSLMKVGNLRHIQGPCTPVLQGHISEKEVNG